MKRFEIALIGVILAVVLLGYLFREQFFTHSPANSPLKATLPVEWTVRQRSTSAVPGSNNSLLLTIDDITRGQVMVSLAKTDGSVILNQQSMREGGVAEFNFGGVDYLLSARSLQNSLLGQDHARFAVTDSATEVNYEKERIEALIAAVEAMEGATFIRNGNEYTPKEAAEHLRSKWEWAGHRIETAEQFIEEIGTKSSESGEPYQIRSKDGTVLPAAKMLELQLRQINKEGVIK
jgi:hypothetical protein